MALNAVVPDPGDLAIFLLISMLVEKVGERDLIKIQVAIQARIYGSGYSEVFYVMWNLGGSVFISSALALPWVSFGVSLLIFPRDDHCCREGKKESQHHNSSHHD